MNCGKTLKYLLEDGHFTQTDLATAIGYSQRAVSKWVNEQAEPTETAICLIANFFGVSTDYLLGRTEIEDTFSGIGHTSEVAQTSSPFPLRLKDLRKERDITQQEVSEAIGGTQSNLAKWETGKTQPAAEAIIKLADFFGVSTDYLLGRTDNLANIQASSPSPLSDEEQELISIFSRMNHAQKVRFLAYGEGMVGDSALSAQRK